MADSDPIIGKQIGHCTIQRKLGQGGMGAVYLAHHPGLNRAVAVKILPGDLASDPEFRDRFFREARLAARLEHPNVVQVHDVGEEQGIHYISMQYIEGKSLDGILREKKKLSLNEALAITKRVAVALSAAAKLGIVHRDIKPHNILLSKDGVVKVADFGLAKDEDANRSISEPGTIMGTPYYMSPEQAKGDKVDPRGDIYSLGATLYHMLTGRRMFDGGTPVSIVMKQIGEEPVPIREIDPSIPEAVAAIVTKMLRKDPAQRFASADDLIRALDEIKNPGASLKMGAAQAGPPPRKAAMIALPIAGILVVGIVVGLILGRGAETKKDPAPIPIVGKVEPSKPEPKPEPKPEVKPDLSAEAKDKSAKAEPPVKPPDPEPPMKPKDRFLRKLNDGVEKKFTEEAMAKVEEFLQAMQKKDTKAIRTMLDEVAFGQITDAQMLDLLGRGHADKGSLESWEIQDLEVRMKMPGLRPQPHALFTMAYDVKLPKGELKITDQPLHLIRKLDGKWYVTRLPKGAKDK